MGKVIKNLGGVTAYKAAVAGGYTGTEEEFNALLANVAIDLAEIENLSVTCTTLPAGSSATASYADGVLSLGLPQGAAGADGVGVPAGGTTGQALVKKSGTDYDTEWGAAGAQIDDTATTGDTDKAWSADKLTTQFSNVMSAIGANVTVTGSTPSITAVAENRYICGEVAELTIVVPASGCVDVVFTSGSTPTVLTVTPPTGMTVVWANDFDPTALEANTTYELNILNGSLGVACEWA
jgi:hypothetical protein